MDVLVNNAIWPTTPINAGRRMERVIDINLNGTYLFSSAPACTFKTRGISSAFVRPASP